MPKSAEDGTNGPATQRDVARLAGVSPVTVSRTLSGGHYVRADLQQRVHDAARQLDYLPNENARGLRPGQVSGLVGVVITSLSNPYYGRLAVGIEEVATQQNRFILIGSTDESAEREERLIDNFLSRKVEGLVVVPAGEPTSRAWLRRLGDVPLVAATREMTGAAVDTVLIDDEEAAYQVGRDLLRDGHRHVGFLGNVHSVSAHRLRFAGIERAFAENGADFPPNLVRGVYQEVDDAAVITQSWLSAPAPPTAIVCANSRLAVGVLAVVTDLVGMKTSRDDLPRIVCFGQLELAELLPVDVRVVSHDPAELGRQAAALLFDRLSGGYEGPARTTKLEQPPDR